MRMAVDKLFYQIGAGISRCECALLLCNCRVQRKLQQHIAHLLADMLVVGLVDCVDELIALLKQCVF